MQKLNILLIGDNKVGKSVFMKRLITGEFIKEYIKSKDDENFNFIINNTQFVVNTNINEKFEYDGVIIMFDLTSRKTYENVFDYLTKIKDVYIVICGNKCDKYEQRKISQNWHVPFYKNNKMHFYEISALSNYNFDKPFVCLKQCLL